MFPIFQVGVPNEHFENRKLIRNHRASSLIGQVVLLEMEVETTRKIVGICQAMNFQIYN